MIKNKCNESSAMKNTHGHCDRIMEGVGQRRWSGEDRPLRVGAISTETEFLEIPGP